MSDIAADKEGDSFIKKGLKWLGEITGVMALLDTAAQTPASKIREGVPVKTSHIKSVEGSTDCTGSIDWRISDRVDKKIDHLLLQEHLDAIPLISSFGVGDFIKKHPTGVIATAPFVMCTALIFYPFNPTSAARSHAAKLGTELTGKVPNAAAAPGCLLFWGVAYASTWMDSELSVGQSTMLSLTALKAPIIGGFIPFLAIALLTLEADTIVNWGEEYTWEAGDEVLSKVGMDSTTFAPFLSKSSGIVDSSKEFLIEDPFLISISKTYTEDGEEVLGVYSE